jgi:hypothetical protein
MSYWKDLGLVSCLRWLLQVHGQCMILIVD